jgi:cytochrome P450 PksS
MPSNLKPSADDLFSPAALQNPYALYQQMRAEDPVHYSEALGYWFLTRYTDVEAALRDERLSANRHSLFVQQLGDLDVSLIQNFLVLLELPWLTLDIAWA